MIKRCAAFVLSAAVVTACDSKTKPEPVSGCATLYSPIYYATNLGITEAEAAASVRIEVKSDPGAGYVVERLEPKTPIHVVKVDDSGDYYYIDKPARGWIPAKDAGLKKPDPASCPK